MNVKNLWNSLIQLIHKPRILKPLFCNFLTYVHSENRPMEPSTYGKPITVTLSVDGNISSGKSTLLGKLMDGFASTNGSRTPTTNSMNISSHVEDKLNLCVEVIPEPLEKWCNMQGYNLLEMLYKNPKKYDFLFEHYVQLTRLQSCKPAKETAKVVIQPEMNNFTNENKPSFNLRIMERSIQSNRFCFMEIAKKSDTLHPAEFSILDEWYRWLEDHIDLRLDLIIYLRTDPMTSYTRMKSRGRPEEICPLEYLNELHTAYEHWLIGNSNLKGQIIVLDGTKSTEEVWAECVVKLEEHLQKLRNSEV